MFAVESVMDELSYKLGLDPVQLRLRNEPDTDPVTGEPISSRPLVECLREGARRFGWDARPPRPRSMPDGTDLLGWGMAVAAMDTFRVPSSARVRADADGRVVVATGTQEIGTGLPACSPSSPPTCSAWHRSPSRSGSATPRCPRPA